MSKLIGRAEVNETENRQIQNSNSEQSRKEKKDLKNKQANHILEENIHRCLFIL